MESKASGNGAENVKLPPKGDVRAGYRAARGARSRRRANRRLTTQAAQNHRHSSGPNRRTSHRSVCGERTNVHSCLGGKKPNAHVVFCLPRGKRLHLYRDLNTLLTPYGPEARGEVQGAEGAQRAPELEPGAGRGCSFQKHHESRQPASPGAWGLRSPRAASPRSCSFSLALIKKIFKKKQTLMVPAAGPAGSGTYPRRLARRMSPRGSARTALLSLRVP